GTDPGRGGRAVEPRGLSSPEAFAHLHPGDPRWLTRQARSPRSAASGGDGTGSPWRARVVAHGLGSEVGDAAGDVAPLGPPGLGPRPQASSPRRALGDLGRRRRTGADGPPTNVPAWLVGGTRLDAVDQAQSP